MISKKIRSARLKKNLSQKELATALGLTSPQFISNIERNLAPVPIHYIPLLSRILGVPQKELVRALIKNFAANCRSELKNIR